MRQQAAQQNVSLAVLQARTLQRCLPRPKAGRTRAVRDVLARGCSGAELVAPALPGVLPAPWHNGTGARHPSLQLIGSGTPKVWLAAIVKDQNQMLEEWLLWHLVLGVTKVLVYDNNSRDQKGLRAVLRPFIEFGAAELVPWPKHASQITAYEDAISRAKGRGVPFVAAIDIDERIVPHGFGCITDSAPRGAPLFPRRPRLTAALRASTLPALTVRAPLDVALTVMAWCSADGGCAGMRLNTRMTEGVKQAAAPSSGSLLQRMHYNLGTWASGGCCVVKTIVRAERHGKWFTPHSTLTLPGPWCHWDEQLQCPTAKGGSKGIFERMPPTAHMAFVLHLGCRTLLDWLVKKSLTGRVDVTAGGNDCPSCFGSLETIAKEYAACCPERRGLRGDDDCFERPKADGPSAREGNIDLQRVSQYLRAVDKRVQKATEALHSATEPSGSGGGGEIWHPRSGRNQSTIRGALSYAWVMG